MRLESSNNKNTVNIDLAQSLRETNKASENCAKINSVQLNNSSQIQFGSTLICNGPVTIANAIQNGSDKRRTVYACCCFEISRKSLKRVLTSLTIVVVIVLIFALVLLAFFLSNARDNASTEPAIRLKTPQKLDDHRFYSREEWKAQSVEPYFQLVQPIKRLIITHTVMRECYNEIEFTKIMQEIQEFHVGRDLGDIGFNFVIMNDGSIFEGRGWDTMGAFAKGYNNNSIGIAYNGDFRKQVPSKTQILAGFALFNEGVRLKKLSPDYKVYGLRQFQSNESPGEAFYQMITTWDQWSDDIDVCCPKN